MGGKIWSDLEERYFWRDIISQSSRRAGIDQQNPEKSWEELAEEMRAGMGNGGRRKYTPTALFEHYFQNAEMARQSPNAAKYVHEYFAKRDCPIHNESGSPPPEPPEPRRSSHITFITDPDPDTYCEDRMGPAGGVSKRSRAQCLCITSDGHVDEKSQTSDSDLSQAGRCGSPPACRPPKESLPIDHIRDKAGDWRAKQCGEGRYGSGTSNTAKVAYPRGCL